jgi:hypothetical protein
VLLLLIPAPQQEKRGTEQSQQHHRAERPAINATFGGESDGNVDDDEVSGTGTTAPDEDVVGSEDWVPTTVAGDVSSAEGMGVRGSIDVSVSSAIVTDDRGSVDVVVVAATKLGASNKVRLSMQNKHLYAARNRNGSVFERLIGALVSVAFCQPTKVQLRLAHLMVTLKSCRLPPPTKSATTVKVCGGPSPAVMLKAHIASVQLLNTCTGERPSPEENG